MIDCLNSTRPLLAAIAVALAAFFPSAKGAGIADITESGVVANGETLNTTAIQKVIDDCSASGGGTLVFPAGRYLTGTIRIKSGVTLRLEKDAVLLGSTRVEDYLNLDPFIDGSGNPMGHALVVAVDAENVGIEGEGTVDGQSPALKRNQESYQMRPFLLRWVRCRNVTVKDVRLTNPGAWTLNFHQSSGILVEKVTIRSRDLGMHNNDGINIDSCENVRVKDCDVISGDDALVIKATSAGKPSRDITATDCKLSTRTNAIKLGTESIGGFEDITVTGCQIRKTQMAGIALYAVDGADLKNVTVSDITMDGVTVPISIRLGARLKAFREGDKPLPQPGRLCDVTIRNVRAKNIAKIGMLINGVPGHPVENLTLESIHLELPGGGTEKDAKVKFGEKEKNYPEWDMFGKTMPAYGIYARHLRGVRFDKVTVGLLKPDARPSTVLIDVEGIAPADFSLGKAAVARELGPREKRVVLIGDSTVASENGWGNAFARLLKPGVECLNMGRGGRSSKSYRKEGHWKKALEAQPGWVLIQFGHNDQPGKGPERETDPQTTFRENLARYVAEARAAGAKPVIITSLTRRNFNAAGKIDPRNLESAVDSQAGVLIRDSLTDYVEAAKAVAGEHKVPLIDLNGRSVRQMNEIGPQAAAVFDAKHKDPNRVDKTHLSPEGAKQTAMLVADEIRLNVSGLDELLLPKQ